MTSKLAIQNLRFFNVNFYCFSVGVAQRLITKLGDDVRIAQLLRLPAKAAAAKR
jgi:hypothetical protein